MSANLPFAKLGFTNCREDKSPVTVWIEPTALDYTLLAGESLEIVATGPQSAPWFNVNACGADLAVYLEGDVHDFVVFQNGRQLEYGHNRAARPEIDRYTPKTGGAT